MKQSMRILSLVLFSLTLTSCGWYWNTSKKVGSYMPTYEGWFGDKEPHQDPQITASNPQILYQSPQPQGQQSNPYAGQPPANPYARQQQQAPRQPSPPRYAPIPGNAYQDSKPYNPHVQQQPYYGQPVPPQGSPPFPQGQTAGLPNPADFPPPSGSGLEAPKAGATPGLRKLMEQGYNPQTQQQQPQPPYYQQQREVQVQPFSGEIEAEVEESGTFGFLDDIADAVGSIFESSENKEPYPNLSTVPNGSPYKARMERTEALREDLEAERMQAAERKATIADWSDLALEEKADEVTPVVVAPEELPMPELVVEVPEEIVIETPAVIAPIVEVPEISEMPVIAAPETEMAPVEEGSAPVLLRRPDPYAGIQLLPRNRYSRNR